MALDWLLQDAPAYVSRGQRIMSVLDGSGSVDVLPGRPDVVVEPSDFDKGEKFNPRLILTLIPSPVWISSMVSRLARNLLIQK